jgi:hypothetical protein
LHFHFLLHLHFHLHLDLTHELPVYEYVYVHGNEYENVSRITRHASLPSSPVRLVEIP